MVVKVPQDGGIRYFDFKCLIGAQIIDETVAFFLDDDSIVSVTFKDKEIAEDVVDDLYYSDRKLFEIDEDDVVEVVYGESY